MAFGPSSAARTHGLLVPNQARYQLRYTRIFNLCHYTTAKKKIIDFSVCGHSCGQSRFYTAFGNRGKSRKHRCHKALRRFALPRPGYRHGTPKAGALPTALHPDIFDFYFVNPVNFDITIRCASLKNIVALLAWSASHCSLFFHLRASPESSAGRGEPLRPTALHPVIFDFLLCYFCETQHNSPLFARKRIEFRLNA